MNTVDVWRGTVVFVLGMCVVLASFVSAVGIIRRRRGAKILCIPWTSVIGVCFCIFVLSIGTSIQLIWWSHHHEPLHWYRSPVIFLCSCVILCVLYSILSFIYRGR